MLLVIAAALVIIIGDSHQAQWVLVSLLLAKLLVMVAMVTSLLLLGVIVSASVNVILDKVLETRLVGRRLGLSTLAVFLSLIFWGSLPGWCPPEACHRGRGQDLSQRSEPRWTLAQRLTGPIPRRKSAI